MAIIKTRKRTNPYVMLDQTFINDAGLSARAKGILVYLLKLPPEWEVHINELVRHFTDGKKAIYSGIRELKAAGYVVYQRHRNVQGSFTAGEYIVYEVPQVVAESASSVPESLIEDVVQSANTAKNNTVTLPLSPKGDVVEPPLSPKGNVVEPPLSPKGDVAKTPLPPSRHVGMRHDGKGDALINNNDIQNNNKKNNSSSRDQGERHPSTTLCCCFFFAKRGGSHDARYANAYAGSVT